MAEQKTPVPKGLSLAVIGNALAQPNVKSWLQAIVPQAFGKYLTPERVAKIVMGAAARNPQLITCKRESLIKSVAEIVSLGLEPGGPLQQAYLVPKRNKGVWEVIPVIGYRGKVTLLRRSGEFRAVVAQAVYASDVFEIDLSFGERPRHHPPRDLTKGRGELVGVYCIADFVGGGMGGDFMSVPEVERIRDMSPAADSEYGPWRKHFDEMAKKTVIHRASKLWPMSTEDLSRAAALEAQEDSTEVGRVDIVDMPDFVDAPDALEEGSKGFGFKKRVTGPPQGPQSPVVQGFRAKIEEAADGGAVATLIGAIDGAMMTDEERTALLEEASAKMTALDGSAA